jgi:hypothetical protein
MQRHERHYSCKDKEQDSSHPCGTIFCERKGRDNRQQHHGCRQQFYKAISAECQQRGAIGCLSAVPSFAEMAP